MIGINLVNDCQRIARAVAANKGLSGGYDNMVKINAPREGFVKVSTPADEYNAIDHVGRSVASALARYENPVTGMKEHILACSKFVQRMLYDKNNKSVGTVLFENPSFPARGVMNYHVLEPAADGRTMEILPDGSKVLYGNGEKYDEHFGIRAFGTMVESSKGAFIPKFFE